MGDAEFGRRLDHRFGAAEWKLSNEPTGQSTIGSRSFWPSASDEASTLLTSRSTRGRNAIEVERHAVAPQRRLGLGAADDIIPIVLVQIGAGLGDELVQIVEGVRGRGIGGGCRVVVVLTGHWHAGFLELRGLLTSGRPMFRPPPWAEASGGEAYRAGYAGSRTAADMPARARMFEGSGIAAKASARRSCTGLLASRRDGCPQPFTNFGAELAVALDVPLAAHRIAFGLAELRNRAESISVRASIWRPFRHCVVADADRDRSSSRHRCGDRLCAGCPGYRRRMACE